MEQFLNSGLYYLQCLNIRNWFNFITIKIQVWQHQAHYKCHSPITAIATSKLSISTSLPPASYIFVALSDSSIRCLNHESLKELAVSSVNMARYQDEPSNKYFKMNVSISHVDISWLGCVLTACDTHGNLYLYKLLPEGMRNNLL